MDVPPDTPRADLASFLEGRGMRVICPLEPGTQPTVLKVRDVRNDRLQVLKLLPEDLRRHASFATDFRVAVARLEKTEIAGMVQTFRLVEGPEFVSALMEYVEGEDLGRVLGREGRLPAARAVRLADAVGVGLLRAHAGGLHHGDLRPSSVMISSSGVVHLLGVGLPHPMPVAPAGAGANEVPYDIPMERVFGRVPSPARADLFRLGFLLYHMLVGAPPFAHPNSHEALFQLRRKDWPSVRRFVPEATPLLDRVLARLSQRTHAYESLEDVLLDLERLRIELPEAPRPVVVEEDRVTRALGTVEEPKCAPVQEAVPRPPSRMRLPIAFASCALLAAAVTGPVFRMRREPPPPPPSTPFLPQATEVEGGGVAAEAQVSDGEQAFLRAVRLADSDPSDVDETVRRFREVVAKYPDTKWAAEAESRAGEALRRADADLDRAWERTTRQVDVLIDWEDFREAIAEIDTFLADHADCRYTPEAKERRGKAQEKGEAWAKAAVGKGKVLASEGKWEEARAIWTRVSQLGMSEPARQEALAGLGKADLALKQADEKKRAAEHAGREEALSEELTRVARKVAAAVEAYDFEEAEKQARAYRSAIDDADYPELAKKADALARVGPGLAKARDAAVAGISASQEKRGARFYGPQKVAGSIVGATRERVTLQLQEANAITALGWDEVGVRMTFEEWSRWADARDADEQLGLGMFAQWGDVREGAQACLEKAASVEPGLGSVIPWLRDAGQKK